MIEIKKKKRKGNFSIVTRSVIIHRTMTSFIVSYLIGCLLHNSVLLNNNKSVKPHYRLFTADMICILSFIIVNNAAHIKFNSTSLNFSKSNIGCNYQLFFLKRVDSGQLFIITFLG